MSEWYNDPPCDEHGKMTTQSWLDCWKTPDVPFHSKNVNKLFQKHRDKLLTRAGMRVFVPLCGKAVEMNVMARDGHQVVGLEVSPIACEAFFTENQIPFTKSPIGKIPGDVYTSTDEKMKVKLYACDYYQFSSDIEGGFEAVWDCGGLNAIDADDQERYLEVMKSVMAPGCRNLTEFCFSPDWPDVVSVDKLTGILGDGYTFSLVEEVEGWPEMKAMGVDLLKLYLIQKAAK